MAQRIIPLGPQFGSGAQGAGLSGASTGVKLTYTVPAGRNAVLRAASVANIVGGAPTVQIRATVGGTTVVLASGTTQFSLVGGPSLNAGDTVDVNVSALIAATTFDASIGVDEYL